MEIKDIDLKQLIEEETGLKFNRSHKINSPFNGTYVDAIVSHCSFVAIFCMHLVINVFSAINPPKNYTPQ